MCKMTPKYLPLSTQFTWTKFGRAANMGTYPNRFGLLAEPANFCELFKLIQAVFRSVSVPSIESYHRHIAKLNSANIQAFKMCFYDFRTSLEFFR